MPDPTELEERKKAALQTQIDNHNAMTNASVKAAEAASLVNAIKNLKAGS